MLPQKVDCEQREGAVDAVCDGDGIAQTTIERRGLEGDDDEMGMVVVLVMCAAAVSALFCFGHLGHKAT